MAKPRAIGARGRRRAPTFLLVLLAGGVLGGPAQGAEVADVRVGRHPTFTRVVVELDAAAGYRLEGPKEGAPPQLRLTVEARSQPRDLRVRDPWVRGVRVTPAGAGSEVVIDLARPGIDVTEMILAGPPRIVLDLHPRAPAPAVGSARPPSRTPAVEAGDRTPGPEVPGRTAPRAAPETAPPAPGVAEPEAVASRPRATEAAGPRAEEGAEPKASEAAEPPASGTAPEARPPASSGEAAEPTRTPAPGPGAAAREPSGTPPGIGAERRAAPGPAPTQSNGPGAFRRNAGRMLIALGVLILLGVWIRTRRRARGEALAQEEPMFQEEKPRELGGEPEGGEAPRPEPETVAGERAEGGEAARASAEPEEAQAAGEAPRAGAPAFDVSEEEARPEPEIPGTRPPETPAVPVPPPRPEPEAPAAEAPPPWQALEERLGRIEARLEDLLDARDRMERQLSAHTEELRVQRSAIARTQRVVRSLARPEPGSGPGTPPAR